MTESKEIKTTVQIAGVDGTHEIAYGIDLDNDTPYNDRTGFITLFDAWAATRDAHHAGGYIVESDPIDGFTVAWHDGDEMNVYRVYGDHVCVPEFGQQIAVGYSLLQAPFELVRVS
jgi:hypothetical protein